MQMASETANKYFQGKENIAMAIARRRIKTGGDIKAALALMPVVKPVYAQYIGAGRARIPPPEGLRNPGAAAADRPHAELGRIGGPQPLTARPAGRSV